jgi:multidrug efflux pump subunit AcrB
MFNSIIRHPIPVTVCALMFCIIGILASTKIPVQMIPDLEVRTISIKTLWPGATPQDVEKEILIEQEEYLRNIPYLEKIQSNALFGQAVVELKFPFGVDITKALIQVNNALNQVPSYPENVDEPVVSATSFSASSFMFLRVSPLPGNPMQLDMDMLRDYVEDNIRPRISSLPGVADVQVAGGAERQIQIHVDALKLADEKLTLIDIRNAIRNRNHDYSAGKIESGKRQYLIRTVGRFSDLEQLGNLILKRNHDELVRLRDVANIQLDHQAVEEKAFINGQPVILLSVKREMNSNVIAIKEAMIREIARINSDDLVDTGMQLHLTSDDVTYVQDSVNNVWSNLILGALLAATVMYLFIRSYKITALAVLGIPICTIASLLGLLLAGRSINVISLAGIAFAVGMTLDNCIVVLESILQQRATGLSRFNSALQGVRTVWVSILASTLTTILVFLPILFIVEEAGQLYSDIAISISASIIASMFVAITLIPVAYAHLPFQLTNTLIITRSKFELWVLSCSTWIVLQKKRRQYCIAFTILAGIASITLLMPPAEYLPEGEEPKTFVALSAPSGYNLEEMERIGREINTYLAPFIDANPNAYDEGNADVPAIRYINMRITPEKLSLVAEAMKPEQIDQLMTALLKKFKTYTEMKAFASRGSIISSNDGGTRSINLDISGPDLASLFRVAQSAYTRAQEVFDNPMIKTTPSSLLLTQPIMQIMPDWERAEELGLSAEDIGFSVSALTDGAYVHEFYLDDNKLDIYMYNQNGPESNLGVLNSILLSTSTNVPIALSEVAHFVESVDTSAIRRLNGQRTVTLHIIPPNDIALEDGVETIRKDLVHHLKNQGVVPVGVNMVISGAADQLDATKKALSANYLAAAIVIYLLMVAIFSHWGHPLLVMITIPLGIAGGIFGLALFNAFETIFYWLGFPASTQAFDMITILGFLILMGTVVNNPILILHKSIENRTTLNMEPIAAVIDALQTRYRAIAISTATTIIGIAPLVFNPGAGSELYRGVGIVVMSGIIGSTIVTMTFLPAITVSILELIKSRAASMQSATAINGAYDKP